MIIDDASRSPRVKSLFTITKAFTADDPFARLRRRMIAGTVAGAALALGALVAVGQYATPDFMILTVALVALCGFVLHDIFSRRLWESEAAQQIDTLIRHHDRLTREMSRNRRDVTALREGLAETALALTEQARRLPPSESAEAQMMGTMVSHLGGLGHTPLLGSGDKPLPAPAADNNSLELRATRPAPRPVPVSALDEELGVDYDQYSDLMIQTLLHTALEDDRLNLFAQPIMRLPQRRPAMMEIFSRVRATPGSYIPAARYIDFARREALLPAIDTMLLLRLVRNMKGRDAGDMIYCLNITRETLADKAFMVDLIEALAENRALAARLVFEMPQADYERLDPRLLAVMDGLSRLQCRFSMDQVRTPLFDMTALRRARVRFLKLDTLWLAREVASQGGFGRISHLKTRMDASGIDIVLEKVENESDLRPLLDFNFDYGQGWLFGKPDLLRARMDARRAA